VHAYFSGNIYNGSVPTLSASAIIPCVIRIKGDLFVKHTLFSDLITLTLMTQVVEFTISLQL
jgi:hypothetical protein